MEKKILVFLVIIILILILFFGSVGFVVLKEVRAMVGPSHNVYGWAWSERIGWISFNCDNDYDGDGNLESHCTDAGYNSDYGVDINLSTSAFSGYAWAGGGKGFDGSPVPTIGWISFGDFDGDGDVDANDKNIAGSPCIPNCEATLDLVSYEVSGWARALSPAGQPLETTGGWDGWIKLRGTNYGVSFDTSTDEFEGWAWGGNDSSEEAVIGWISFNCQDGGYVEEHFSSITGETSDGFILGYSSSYSTALSTSNGFGIIGSTLSVGQEYNETGGCSGIVIGDCSFYDADCDDQPNGEDDCNNEVIGCYWVGCTGTPDSCDSYDFINESACNQAGCYWDGCEGTPPPCDDYGTQDECEYYPYCEWINLGYGFECTGTPDSCDTYDGFAFACGLAGCDWIGCEGTPGSCDSFDCSDDCEYLGCSWLACQGTPTPCRDLSSETCESQYDCHWAEDEEFDINRAYLDFDTSSIPDDAIITDVKLSLKASQNESDTDFDVEIWKFTWAEPITSGNREANYDASGAVYDADWRNTSGMLTGVYYDSPSLDNSWVNLTGDTRYQLRSSRDVNEDEPYGDEYIEFYSANSAGNKPILKVTYTIEAAPAGEHYNVCGDSDYKVKSTLNQPPDKPTGLNESWGCCGGIPQVALRTCLILNWSYLDPDGDPQAGYEVWVDDSLAGLAISPDLDPKFNHVVDSGSAPSYTVDLAADDEGDWFSRLDWGTTYHWKVKVKDSNGGWSEFSDPDSFTMPNRASPKVDFTPNPINPRTEEEVTFIDNSKCYLSDDSSYSCKNEFETTGENDISYEWDFDYEPTEGFTVDDTFEGDATYTYPEAGNYIVQLQITDIGVGGPFTGMCWKEVIIGFPLPTWKEITPF